jgi:hypothetical protein
MERRDYLIFDVSQPVSVSGIRDVYSHRRVTGPLEPSFQQALQRGGSWRAAPVPR